MKKAIAVIAGDIHYNLTTLKLADAGTRQAIAKANELKVPLIINGDLHDTKANMRGECVNAMIETFKLCNSPPYIICGNHDRLNEKAPEHSLNFLAPYAMIIDKPTFQYKLGWLIPYHHDAEELKSFLSKLDKGSQLIMHQGLQSANLGEYIQDKSAISTNDVASFRVIASHYHARQTIKLPDNGRWDYIGNLFTTSYGEANDLPKGYAILMSDGSLEFVPTKLRKHVVIEIDADLNVKNEVYLPRLNDLVWVKVRDTHENLAKINRQKVKEWLTLETFKLDLIPLDTKTSQVSASENLTTPELFDSLIDSLTNTSDERKIRLKELWRHLGS